MAIWKLHSQVISVYPRAFAARSKLRAWNEFAREAPASMIYKLFLTLRSSTTHLGLTENWGF